MKTQYVISVLVSVFFSLKLLSFRQEKSSKDLYISSLSNYVTFYRKVSAGSGTNIKPDSILYVIKEGCLNNKDTVLEGARVSFVAYNEYVSNLEKGVWHSIIKVHALTLKYNKYVIEIDGYSIKRISPKRVTAVFGDRGIYALEYNCDAKEFELKTLFEGDTLYQP